MPKFSVRSGVASFLSALAGPALPENKSITGQLIDIGGYAEGRPVSEYTGVHARALTLEGFEVGVLTSDGKVYHITGAYHAQNNAKLFPFMLAKSVTVTGDVSEKDGQMWIEATDVK
jgi:hypothetical protein